jgi:hypothetical protein
VRAERSLGRRAARRRRGLAAGCHDRPVRTPRALAAVAVTVIVAAGVSACGSAETPDATQVARQFARAVDGSAASAACSYLAPATRSRLEQSAGRRCPAAILQQHLPSTGAVRSATAYGTMAQVRLRGDTLFLARFQGGWKVMAAGCSPKAGHPYDCTLEGG